MRPNTNPPAWLTPTTFADLLCVSVSTFYRRLRSGMLPEPVSFGDRSPRWPLREIREWVDAGCPRRARWKEMRKPAPPRNPRAGKGARKPVTA